MEDKAKEKEVKKIKNNPLDDWEKQIDIVKSPVMYFTLYILITILIIMLIIPVLKNRKEEYKKIDQSIETLKTKREKLDEEFNKVKKQSEKIKEMK